DSARCSAPLWRWVSDTGAQVNDVLVREFSQRRREEWRTVQLAALIVDLERTHLGDRLGLCPRGEPVPPHFAAEPERDVVNSLAIREGALVQARHTAIAAVDGLASRRTVHCSFHGRLLRRPHTIPLGRPGP